MGYENPSTELTFYKAFFSPQWKFLLHTILQCMSAKRKSWNEFSSSMALAVICLSTGRKFNLSKYIFDSLVRNVDSSSKFYVYTRFLQLMIRAQVGDLSSHTTKYASPALTQKVFANMKRVGKGFSRVETPLFKGMIVAQQANDVDDKVAAGVDVDDEDASKQEEIIANIDADEDVTLKDVATVAKNVEVEKDDDEPKPAELQEVIEVVTTAKLMTEVVTAATTTITAATTPITVAPSAAKRRKGVDEAYARELEEELKKTINWDDVIEQVQRKKKEDNDVLSKEQLEEEESRALKRQSESLEEKAAKKQTLGEEVEELKKHLQIVPNDDNDVYTETTPLALKVLEDLEVLWQLVKERFDSSKPKNFSDDFLLTTLTYMFEKPNIKAQVWKNQRGVHGLAKVKTWRLLDSCRVHIITFTTTQMILLVERRYPLTRFTFEQMLNNVRLEVKEVSEVSLELLRFVRQQQLEGYRPE
uniref:Glutamic acid-rich protein-like n=1 Tax=Tanacetum cinerariifolium TaxID=118510 RepID=A0A6L2LS66_TANCI|nr:hypothetical protein [Tanacetum cinerariifolium]